MRRLLAVKFDLGLFDNPYVDEGAAGELVGSAEFVAEGTKVQQGGVEKLSTASAMSGLDVHVDAAFSRQVRALAAVIVRRAPGHSRR